MDRSEANQRLSEISTQMRRLKEEAISLCDTHKLNWTNPVAGYGSTEQDYIADPDSEAAEWALSDGAESAWSSSSEHC